MGLTRIRAQQISDIDYKQAVRVVSTANVTLSGGAPSEVDSVSLMAGDRILVAGQSDARQNGLYFVQTLGTGANGTWTRTSDANQTGEIFPGMIVMITEGATWGDTQWLLVTNGEIIIGTTELNFQRNVGGKVTVSESPPAMPRQGDYWIDSDTAIQYIYFNDGNSSQWAEMEAQVSFSSGSGGGGGGGANVTVSATPPVSPSQGDVWIDSDTAVQLLYFDDGNSSQWAEMEAQVSISGGGGSVDFEDISSNVLPSANVTYNLGSSDKRWNDLWLANSTIHLGEVSISASGGNLELPATVQIGNVTLSESDGNLQLPSGTTVGGETVVMPKIANIQITNSSWTVLDDTAISTDGGFFIINGAGFQSVPSVSVDGTNASSVTFVSSELLRCQIGGKAAASYTVYVVNPDGTVALRPSGLTYSGLPTWVTNSTLANAFSSIPFTYTLEATGAVSYALAPGNTVPTGSTLAANGVFSGNVVVADSTSYSFTVTATDAEQQDADRTFSLTVIPDILVEYLVVAGGGGGGGTSADASIGGGGGGAGGYRTGTLTDIQPGTNITVTVGGGGSASSATIGGQGTDSVFASITSTGGGGGAKSTGNLTGGSGGSGGGGSQTGTGGSGNTPSTSPSQGNNGGNGTGSGGGGLWGAGGGGGAGASGNIAVENNGGNGGNGSVSSITGSSVYYAGGGGGGAYSSATAGTGGLGGGANGSNNGNNGSPGTTNTGGGGGGCGGAGGAKAGGTGGSGVVILKYPNSFTLTNPGDGLTFTTSTAVEGYKITTFTAGTGNIQFS